MNSQVLEQVCTYIDVPITGVEALSSSALNSTYNVGGGGVLHLSSQPQLNSSEESLILDRYIYDNKAQVMKERVREAAAIADSMEGGRIKVPLLICGGELMDTNTGTRVSYWVDEAVPGVNAKNGIDVMGLTEYKTVIDWIIAAQRAPDRGGESVSRSYELRADGFESLYEQGYYDSVLNISNRDVFIRSVDLIRSIAQDEYLDRPAVFKHGDLHVANILRLHDDSLAIIDFESSFGGPGDSMKDIMKLLHLEYVFFDVEKTNEGAFLTSSERMLLLDYYTSNSGLEDRQELRSAEYLKGRVALDSLMRYITRLTLASRQGGVYGDSRVKGILGNMSGVLLEGSF